MGNLLYLLLKIFKKLTVSIATYSNLIGCKKKNMPLCKFNVRVKTYCKLLKVFGNYKFMVILLKVT